MIMLLNTKSLSTATKQIGILFVLKSINNLLYQMFSKCCMCTVFWPSQTSWYIIKCLTEGWQSRWQVKLL